MAKKRFKRPLGLFEGLIDEGLSARLNEPEDWWRPGRAVVVRWMKERGVYKHGHVCLNGPLYWGPERVRRLIGNLLLLESGFRPEQIRRQPSLVAHLLQTGTLV